MCHHRKWQSTVQHENLFLFHFKLYSSIINNFKNLFDFVLVDEWCKSKKMKYLGVPKYISSGSHTRGKETFRFMVMERFGSDVQKVFEKSGKKFSKHTVCALALRLVRFVN